MTTSGTATFNIDLTEVVEEAYERAGSELRTGYDMRSARRSLNLLFADWANRGVNLWTMDSNTITLVPGTAQYTMPADTVDLVEHVIRTGAGSVSTQADLTLTRISVSTYATIPNKLATGRPIQLYVNRQGPAPILNLWPVPDTATPYVLAYWRLRRIQDAGTGVNTMDVPFRFLTAMVAGLAYYLALKKDADLGKSMFGAARLQMLKQQYDEAWQMAADEDRDKSSIRLVPRRMHIG